MAKATPKTLSQKIDWLFDNIHRPDGKEYTYQEVENATRELGYPISAPYIWNLRKGKSDNPSWMVLQTLARFFGISVTYFYDESLNDEKLRMVKLEALMNLKDVEEIAFRASKMTTHKRKTLLEMMRAFTN